MIIVYGNEEKLAASTATMFVQKGWENVFMLSGGEQGQTVVGRRQPLTPPPPGLKIVAQKFPLLVEGKVPDSLKASPKKGGRSRTPHASCPLPVPHHPHTHLLHTAFALSITRRR